MKRVGIFEAKTHFSSLLDEVEKGGEITITRHGKPIAKLVQIASELSQEEIAKRKQALNELRAMAKARGTRTTHSEIKRWIAEGRH
jgi:prevent-host-death family protein